MHALHAFDASVLHAINAFAQRWFIFDRTMAFLEDSHLFKGGIVVALLWMLWLQPAPVLEERTRRAILAMLAGSAGAILLARGLAAMLPFRYRPLHQSELDFAIPLGFEPSQLWGWSSFPSDHAALFFGLATGVFGLSRRLGWLLLLHALFIVSLPRLFLGIHYPTDILAGAILGILCVWLAERPWVSQRIWDLAAAWLRQSPASFYLCFYVATFEVAVLFDDLRGLGHLASGAAKYLKTGAEF